MDKFISDLVDSLPRRDIIEIALKNSFVGMLINERVKNDETVQQMAHRLCMSKKRYQTWESGDHDFTVRDIAWICEKLGRIPMIAFCTENIYPTVKKEHDEFEKRVLEQMLGKEQEDETRENMG